MLANTDRFAEYADIIALPRHCSLSREQMPLHARAAQFAPYAALVGYDAEIRETARLTNTRPELDEDAAKRIDDSLQLLSETAEQRPPVTITFFVPDIKKEGGSYITVSGNFKMIDISDNTVVMSDNKKIRIEDIIAICCDKQSD